MTLATDDPLGPPRSNGELTFDAPWQGRAFGMCVVVLERQGLTWDDFRPHLVAAIAEHPDAPYYDAFVIALDRLLGELELIA